MKRVALLAIIAICISTVLVGCGKHYTKTEGVTGVVTLDGKPLPNANVYFVPLDTASGALPSFAKTNENGEYQLQTLTGAANAGTTPGKYGVKFDAQEAIDTGKTIEENGKTIEIKESKSILPKRYNDEKTSGEEVEVVPGANVFNFDLQSK